MHNNVLATFNVVLGCFLAAGLAGIGGYLRSINSKISELILSTTLLKERTENNRGRLEKVENRNDTLGNLITVLQAEQQHHEEFHREQRMIRREIREDEKKGMTP